MSKDEYLNVAKLKERCWTGALIRDYLKVPDKLCQNPFYSKAAPMRLYLSARVEALEMSPEWQTAQERSKPRKISATRAVQTKMERLLAAVEEIQITVPSFPLPQVIQNACDKYNHFHDGLDSDHDWLQASTDSDSCFLDRITVNYLRHQLSSYEKEIEEVFGKVGVRQAYKEINRKVYAAISEAYPVLSKECHRQLKGKCVGHTEEICAY